MNIIGISAFYHDAAAALLCNGEVVAAAQEERFTRIKNDASFPRHALKFCLDFAGLSAADIDAVAFYEKPLLKFERLLETHIENAPTGFLLFLKSMPVWIKQKLFIKSIIRSELNALEKKAGKKIKLLFPPHHLSHAASAYFASPYSEAAILTVDGVGEWATTCIYQAEGNKITLLKEQKFPDSVGLLYSSFTHFLGFKVNSGEYKLMGLAPYGDKYSDEVKKYIRLIKQNLVDIKPDGSIILNRNYFRYTTSFQMIDEKKWSKLFSVERRKPEAEILQQHCSLAYAAQKVTEEILLALCLEAKRLAPSENLCMAGGVALNCVANSVLAGCGAFKNIFVQPAAGDAGGALGAAWAARHIYFDEKKKPAQGDDLKGTFLGPSISEKEVEDMVVRNNAVCKKYTAYALLCKDVAHEIVEGKIVAWVQGRMEFGPRALGNRSILADARMEGMKKKINLSIKYRESFRPFAPAVMQEDAHRYFNMDTESPFMLFTYPVKENICKIIPRDYEKLSPAEKSEFFLSELPAITHLDYSARVQTINPQAHPEFYRLLAAFKELTGCSVLLNTSFNVRGEPIICTADDAYRCFMKTELDVLVIGNYVFQKNQQPAASGKNKLDTK